MQLLWEFRDDIVPPMKHGAEVRIDALQVIKVARSRGPATEAEARALGDTAVGHEDKAAVVIPNGFFVAGLSRKKRRSVGKH